MAEKYYIPQPIYTTLASISGRCPYLYKAVYRAGVLADRHIHTRDPEQRQKLFEGIVSDLSRGVTIFSDLRTDKKAIFLDTSITQPGFGTVMSALIAGSSFSFSNAPSWLYFDFLGHIKPDYCAKILARLPFYYNELPINAIQNHLVRGLHGTVVNEILYSRNFENIPIVLGKEDVWYYSCIGTVLSDMAKRMGAGKVFAVIDMLLTFDNGPKLVEILSNYIHLPQ